MIYVDTPRPVRFRRFKKTSHMMTDGDIDELHKFAAKIGLRREWFQNHPAHPHYDLFDSRIEEAIRHGAKVVTPNELVRKCSAVLKEKSEP